MRICAFGSSSRDLDALYIDAAYELGRTLAEHGPAWCSGATTWD